VPRRHRSARDRRPSPLSGRPAGSAPAWAHAPGFTIRQVTGDKPYRCPGCQGMIQPGMVHLVVVPDHDPESRRHWHAACWRRELRRRS
jgi:hypothetical protein